MNPFLTQSQNILLNSVEYCNNIRINKNDLFLFHINLNKKNNDLIQNLSFSKYFPILNFSRPSPSRSNHKMFVKRGQHTPQGLL